MSTSFLHVFVRRMQGVDLLDRRVTALEDRVADFAPVAGASLEIEATEAHVTISEPSQAAQVGEANQASEGMLAAPLPQGGGEMATPVTNERPPAYTIPRDAAGGFGLEQQSGSIAEPIFDLSDAAPANERDVATELSELSGGSRLDHTAIQGASEGGADRSIDGLVRQLSQGMSGLGDTASAASNQDTALEFDRATLEHAERPMAAVAEQFGQRAAPPMARREAGETPLISMPQTAPAETSDQLVFPSNASVIGDTGSSANVIADPIGQAIHDAASRGDVDIYLQPILSIDDRKVRFFEVLGRVIGLGGDVIATEDHVEVSRSVRATAKLDRAVMIRAARLLRKLSERRQAQPLFCNISKETVADGMFTQDFIAFMGGYRDLAPFMIFEFDQVAIAEADTTAINNIRALGAMGFRLSIDNVSNVEQALANGRELDVSFVKLPYETFVPAQQNQADARARAATIQNVARDSGMTIIVDRIERKDQLAGVVGAGVNLGQGYLFSEPKPLLPQVAAEVAEAGAAA